MDGGFVMSASSASNNADQPPRELVPREQEQRGSATGVAEAQMRTPTGQLPQFRVLLHNDDVNDPMFVIGAVVELAPLTKEQAVLVVLEAESTGVGLVLVTHKERAELYQDQFTSKGLTVTIEPAA